MAASWEGHDDGRPSAIDAVEQLHDPDARRRVQVSGRLVGEQDHRSIHERASDYALLLTTRQLVGHPVALAVETDQVEDLGTTLPIAERGLPITSSAKATFSETVLLGSRKSWKTVPTRRSGDLPVRQAVQILAGDMHAAARGPALRGGQGAGRSTCRIPRPPPGRRIPPRSTSTSMSEEQARAGSHRPC